MNRQTDNPVIFKAVLLQGTGVHSVISARVLRESKKATTNTDFLRKVLSFTVKNSPGGGGGELPYEEYMGMCHELGSHFQEKIPKRVYQFFAKIPKRAIISVRNSR